MVTISLFLVRKAHFDSVDGVLQPVSQGRITAAEVEGDEGLNRGRLLRASHRVKIRTDIENITFLQVIIGNDEISADESRVEHSPRIFFRVVADKRIGNLIRYLFHQPAIIHETFS